MSISMARVIGRKDFNNIPTIQDEKDSIFFDNKFHEGLLE